MVGREVDDACVAVGAPVEPLRSAHQMELVSEGRAAGIAVTVHRFLQSSVVAWQHRPRTSRVGLTRAIAALSRWPQVVALRLPSWPSAEFGATGTKPPVAALRIASAGLVLALWR